MTTHIPTSLVSPESTGDKRAIVGVTAVVAAPTSSDAGIPTRNNRRLHVVAQARVGGSFDMTLWVRYKDFGPWCLLSWFGTGGTKTITNGSPFAVEPVDIHGADNVAVQISNIVGAAECDVWLAGSSF